MSDKVTYRCPTCGFQTLTIDNDGRFVCMMAYCAAPHGMDQLVEAALWIRSMAPGRPTPPFLVRGAGEQAVRWDKNGHDVGSGGGEASFAVPSGTAGGGGGNLSTTDYLNQTIMNLRNTVNDQAARIKKLEGENDGFKNVIKNERETKYQLDATVNTLQEALAENSKALDRAAKEIADAREACPSIRHQDNGGKSLLELINLEVANGFKLDTALDQVQANSAKALAEKDIEIAHLKSTNEYLWGTTLICTVCDKPIEAHEHHIETDSGRKKHLACHDKARLDTMIADVNKAIEDVRESLRKSKKSTGDGGFTITLDNTAVEMREVDRSMFVERLNALKTCNNERAVPCRVCGMSIDKMLKALELEVPLTAPDGRNLVSALRKLADQWMDDADRAKNDCASTRSTSNLHASTMEEYTCRVHARELVALIGGGR